jgi:uncharacterized protein YndB with AHSA1/START domain
VVFHPPGLEAFTEDRVLSAIEPPHRLAYSMTALFGGQPGFLTEVELTFAPEGTGTRLILTQRGFPDAATATTSPVAGAGYGTGSPPVNMTRARLGRLLTPEDRANRKPGGRP